MYELPETRQSLLRRLHENSDGAWGEFLDVYEQAIYAFCRRQRLQDSDARDVTQDVLVAIHDRLSDWDFSANGKFRGWLVRVAGNISVNKIKERSRRSAGSDSETNDLLAQLPASQQNQETLFLLKHRSG